MTEPTADGAGVLPDEPASTEEEARERYELTRASDPFPEIAPALLNSADVWDYVRVTGMIWPFDPDRLKAASYEVSIGRMFIYWDGENREHRMKLNHGEQFYLEPNSIGFATTKEIFRLPHYIAARFNLRISNVHRGILLGTGPLVDPGFCGQLLVPLHNLTANRYAFKSGEEFAWFEFTKVSPNFWDAEYMESRHSSKFLGEYREFPEKKRELLAENYLAKAWPGPIPSSIPSAIAEYKKFAEDSKNAAENAERTLRRIGWIAAAGVLIATLGVVVPSLYSSWQLIGGVKDAVSDLGRENLELRSVVEQQELDFTMELDQLYTELATMHDEFELFDVASVQRQLEDLRSSMSVLEAEVEHERGDMNQP